MFEKQAKEYYETETPMIENITGLDFEIEVCKAYRKGAESTLRKVIKYFSTIVLDENCGGYFSRLLESEKKCKNWQRS